MSFEHRIGDVDAGVALAAKAMYADLAIVRQRDQACWPWRPKVAPACW